jgi:glycerol uptake facilitator-like aquaporin
MKRLIRSRRFHILFFESLGSFILVYGACSAGLHVAQDIIVAASLFLAVSLTGEVTGGYINPLITIGTYVEHRHNKLKLYLGAQMLGAFLGALWSWAILGNIEAPYQEGWDSIEPVKFIMNEFMGAFIFTICVLVLTNRYTSHAVKSWQIYLSIPVALFLTRKYSPPHADSPETLSSTLPPALVYS